jgi:Tfp pilus assembly pilus retraction ATPase PilT
MLSHKGGQSLSHNQLFIPIEEETIDIQLWNFLKKTGQISAHWWKLVEGMYTNLAQGEHWCESLRPSFLCVLKHFGLIKGLHLAPFYQRLGYETVMLDDVDPWWAMQLKNDDGLFRWFYTHDIVPIDLKEGRALHLACSWPHTMRHHQALMPLLQSKNPNLCHIHFFHTPSDVKHLLNYVRHYELINHINAFLPTKSVSIGAHLKKTRPAISFDDEGNGANPYGFMMLMDGHRYFDHLLNHAVLHQATDIHWMPQKDWVDVLLRCAGKLHLLPFPLPLNTWHSLVGYLKVKAAIDISKVNAPQTGLWAQEIGSAHYYCRISEHPTIYGPSISMRLLRQDFLNTNLQDLGFCLSQYERIKDVISKEQGIFLFCGATGSGKTTTMYTIVRQFFLKKHGMDEASAQWSHSWSEKNIMTLEDPVEYHLPHIRQSTVHDSMGYEEGLASILRHDPDIIIVGEIRTQKTAQLALEASRSGHLVLATIHGKSPQSAIERFKYLVGPDQAYTVDGDIRLCMHQVLMDSLSADVDEEKKQSYPHTPVNFSDTGSCISKRRLMITLG